MPFVLPYMRAMLRPLTLALLTAGPAAAHPHVFVTAELELRLNDDGELLGVHVTWAYDEFFSLLVTEELGIDPDGDMVLTADENAALTDYIAAWPEDYEGDVYITRDGSAVILRPVQEHTVTFENGIVREGFYRAFATPQDTITAPVQVQVYDPFYYVAYEVAPPMTVIGRVGCTATLVKADLNAANIKVDALLYGRPASDVGPDEAFPEVGVAFAETVTVACSG